MLDEEFKVQITQTGKAIYDPEIAQNYIPLMRKMIYAYRSNPMTKDSDNLLPQHENLFIMFMKNKEELSSSNPRFLNILYEFGSVIPKTWRKAMNEIENSIVNEHLNTMPVAAIKSFLYHMSKSGLYNLGNLNKIL